MADVIGGLLLLSGLYFFYMAYKTSTIPDQEYISYKKELSNTNGWKGVKQVFIGASPTTREAVCNGDSRDQETGELKIKSSLSPEHTKSLFRD